MRSVDKVDKATASRVVSWLWRTARDERPFVALGVVGSAIGGATQPLLGFLMAEFLVAFFNHSTSHMRREARFWALMFVAMAGCAAIGELWKSYGLSRAAEHVVRDVFRARARVVVVRALRVDVFNVFDVAAFARFRRRRRAFEERIERVLRG